MIEKYNIRTDLALEEKERFEADHVEIQGVVLEESYNESCEVRTTTVKIETENGAKTMGKPVGTYITMEVPNLGSEDDGYHEEITGELIKCLEKVIYGKTEDGTHAKVIKNRKSVLVVGLGNRKVTPDALGPLVVDNLKITRHIVKEFGKYAFEETDGSMVSAIVPGVMGQTGMETVEIIKGIVSETEPDLLIVVDALAARNSKRLNRTIQIADTGIHPGSGVGNHRNAIVKETVGIPVIAIGIPTVVDAATIANDTMETLLGALETSETLRGVGLVMQGYSGAEKYELIKELISPHLNGLFVTPKDMDETVKRISFTISEALNRFFSGGHAHIH